jgi:hypothetical protein
VDVSVHVDFQNNSYFAGRQNSKDAKQHDLADAIRRAEQYHKSHINWAKQPSKTARRQNSQYNVTQEQAVRQNFASSAASNGSDQKQLLHAVQLRRRGRSRTASGSLSRTSDLNGIGGRIGIFDLDF